MRGEVLEPIPLSLPSLSNFPLGRGDADRLAVEPKDCAGFWLEERSGRRNRRVSNAHKHCAKGARSAPILSGVLLPYSCHESIAQWMYVPAGSSLLNPRVRQADGHLGQGVMGLTLMFPKPLCKNAAENWAARL